MGIKDPSLEPDYGIIGREESPVGATDADPVRRDLRTEIGKFASLVEYPTTPAEIIEIAEANLAPDPVMAELRSLDPQTKLETAHDLWVALDLEATNRF
jgi:hypothetical protein